MKRDSGSIFEKQRWPLSIATAWVLTREPRFVEGCVRDRGQNAPELGPVETEAADWRFNTMVSRRDLDRRPVMLFPTVDSAAQRLREAFPEQDTFSQREVLTKFPRLDDADRVAVFASMWSGQSPHDHEWLLLSHAAWWVASGGGRKLCVLDDARTWEKLLASLSKTVAIFGTHPPPYCRIAPDEFVGVPFEYPCRAFSPDLEPNRNSWNRLGPVYEPGRDTFIRCTLDPRETFGGDLYYLGNPGLRIVPPPFPPQPRWGKLMVRSAELLESSQPRSERFTASINRSAARPRQALLKQCPAEQYEQHWKAVEQDIGVGPSGRDDDRWAREHQYSVESVRNRRKQFIDALSPDKRAHIRRGGPRKPFSA
jgi:hypothetical protein